MRLDIYGANNLNFIEFNTSGDSNSYIKCDKESMFMDTDLFNLFSECFEKSNNLYDYFGPTKYNSRNFVILLNELKNFLEKINKIDSIENFIDFSGSKFLGANFVMEIEKNDKNWRLNWEFYKEKLISINKKLINLINECIDKDKNLWLIGY